jgi:hypothetical protein
MMTMADVPDVLNQSAGPGSGRPSYKRTLSTSNQRATGGPDRAANHAAGYLAVVMSPIVMPPTPVCSVRIRRGTHNHQTNRQQESQYVSLLYKSYRTHTSSCSNNDVQSRLQNDLT